MWKAVAHKFVGWLQIFNDDDVMRCDEMWWYWLKVVMTKIVFVPAFNGGALPSLSYLWCVAAKFPCAFLICSLCLLLTTDSFGLGGCDGSPNRLFGWTLPVVSTFDETGWIVFDKWMCGVVAVMVVMSLFSWLVVVMISGGPGDRPGAGSPLNWPQHAFNTNDVSTNTNKLNFIF